MRPTVDGVVGLARAAGEILMRHFGRLLTVEKKGARDLVSAADRESEAYIVDALRRSFPGHGIVAEESAAQVISSGPAWIVDPLDGTTNFVYGIPQFAVSIAFVQDGLPQLSCVLNPASGECYTAERGAGAWSGQERLRVRTEERLSEALLATGFAYRLEELEDDNTEHWRRMSRESRGLRRFGAAALDLAWVAAGRFDGFWEWQLAPWDVAAGALLVSEAGGVVTDRRGGQEWLFGRSIVAANSTLHAELLRVLGQPIRPV